VHAASRPAGAPVFAEKFRGQETEKKHVNTGNFMCGNTNSYNRPNAVPIVQRTINDQSPRQNSSYNSHSGVTNSFNNYTDRGAYEKAKANPRRPSSNMSYSGSTSSQSQDPDVRNTEFNVDNSYNDHCDLYDVGNRFTEEPIQTSEEISSHARQSRQNSKSSSDSKPSDSTSKGGERQRGESVL
jgi:hypothetical protein